VTKILYATLLAALSLRRYSKITSY